MTLPCQCWRTLEKLAEHLGVAVETSTQPFPQGAYSRPPFKCPCGTLWYYQPTQGQILEWSVRGAR